MRVWVNGTFDVLHVGHVSLLQFASLFGKVRVGIDTDRRVKELKGDDRPVNNWNDRCLMLKELRSVKEVVGFEGKLEFDTNRPDGALIKLTDNSKVTSLGWKPKVDLKVGLKRAYEW